MKFFNYPKMIKDLYALIEKSEVQYQNTLRIMLDECVMHFFQVHNVPFEKQAEFLSVMLDDCPKAIMDYKNKRFV